MTRATYYLAIFMITVGLSYAWEVNLELGLVLAGEGVLTLCIYFIGLMK